MEIIVILSSCLIFCLVTALIIIKSYKVGVIALRTIKYYKIGRILRGILLGTIIPPTFGFLLYFIVLALDKLHLYYMTGDEGLGVLLLIFYGSPIGAIVSLIRK